jgi:hypothetical protein
MSKTLNAGEHRLVFTSGVNDRIAEDSKFAKFVYQSIVRFNRADWGSVEAEDWKANDADLKSLNNGGWYGRILASYRYTNCYEDCHRITVWIIRNTADEDGTQAITVLFPDEY